MALKKEPFRAYRLDDDRVGDERLIFTVSLNKKQKKQLLQAKKILRQSKNGTCLKQLAEIGFIVLHDQIFGSIYETILKNKKNNEKAGILDDDSNFSDL